MTKKLTSKSEPKVHHIQISDELWGSLLASAKHDLRTPTGQIAYILRSFLTEERSEHE